jgi:hypothetical protein
MLSSIITIAVFGVVYTTQVVLAVSVVRSMWSYVCDMYYNKKIVNVMHEWNTELTTLTSMAYNYSEVKHIEIVAYGMLTIKEV